jgi:hypothetical protein
LLWLVEPTPLVPLSDDAAGVGVLLAPLLEEPGVLVVADPAAVPEVAVDVAPDVSADVPVAAELATPATSVAPRAAPAVATPAAVNVARRNTRFGRLGGGVVVMRTTITGDDSSQPQPTIKCTSRSVRRRLNNAGWSLTKMTFEISAPWH